jgi:hypothetical protein
MFQHKAVKNRLGWYRWEWADPYSQGNWTACTISIYEPTYERPYIGILVSIANGGGRVLFRCATLEEAQQRTGLDYTGYKKLEVAVIKAKSILLEVQADLKAIWDMKQQKVETQIESIVDAKDF